MQRVALDTDTVFLRVFFTATMKQRRLFCPGWCVVLLAQGLIRGEAQKDGEPISAPSHLSALPCLIYSMCFSSFFFTKP